MAGRESAHTLQQILSTEQAANLSHSQRFNLNILSQSLVHAANRLFILVEPLRFRFVNSQLFLESLGRAQIFETRTQNPK